MTNPELPDPESLTAIASNLLEVVGSLSKRVGDLAKAVSKADVVARKARHLTFGLALSVSLDIILSVILIVVAIGQGNTSNRISALASQNRTALVTSCRANNVIKADDINLWESILPTKPTATISAVELNTIQHLVHVRDQPVNCIARYH